MGIARDQLRVMHLKLQTRADLVSAVLESEMANLWLVREVVGHVFGSSSLFRGGDV